jgi:hypothetical protein
MRAIIVYPQGRLGNLLFQFTAAGEVADGGYIITLASEATDHFMWDGKLLILPCPKPWRSLATSFWVRTLRLLSHMELVGVIKPARVVVDNGYETEVVELKTKIGLFPGIFVTFGFFHHDQFKKMRPKLTREVRAAAEERLKDIPNESRVGVHFRFGDYETWSVYGIQGTNLPVAYYMNAFKVIEQKVKDPCYIIFSDDIRQARSLMRETGKACIVYEGISAIEDFAGMASCSHAVVSASSFAWWAAELISNLDKLVVAPEYWLGFKSQCWFPAQIKTKGFIYVSSSVEMLVSSTD